MLWAGEWPCQATLPSFRVGHHSCSLSLSCLAWTAHMAPQGNPEQAGPTEGWGVPREGDSMATTCPSQRLDGPR